MCDRCFKRKPTCESKAPPTMTILVEHCNFQLVRWMARKGYLKREVDQLSKILCDSCRLARAAQQPVEKEAEAKLHMDVKKTDRLQKFEVLNKTI